MMSTLELLPMFSGVDPDVELYASGLVTEDAGDWVGGQALQAAAADAAGGLQLFYLENISKYLKL